MKKITLLLILAVFLHLTSVHTATAQQDAGQSAVTAGVGVSIAGLLINAYTTAITTAVSSTNAISFSTSSIPVIFGSYDYGVNRRFSIGLAASYQSWSVGIPSYVDQNTMIPYAPSSISLSRINYALRPLIHFGRSTDLDLYTGLRLGYTTWTLTNTSLDPNLKSVSFGSTSNFAPAVLFGLRYYFSKVIGAGLEVSIGAPYAVAVGLNARF